jgi:hypothetical protein
MCTTLSRLDVALWNPLPVPSVEAKVSASMRPEAHRDPPMTLGNAAAVAPKGENIQKRIV